MSFSQMSGTSGEGGQSSNLQLNFTRQGEFGGENDPTTNINTTLLVPAFLTSGVLLIGILAVLLWKRTAYSRAIAALEASQRVGVTSTGQGNERVASRNDRDTVPRERPILWDMWLETPQLPRESDSNFWENIQPVSVHLLQNPPRSNGSNKDDLSRNANLPNLNSIARKRRGPMSTALRTQVSVLIAMPSQRPIHEKLVGVNLHVDGNLPEQSRKYPHDIMFGITDLDVACSNLNAAPK